MLQQGRDLIEKGNLIVKGGGGYRGIGVGVTSPTSVDITYIMGNTGLL